jgi:hypothetical protein
MNKKYVKNYYYFLFLFSFKTRKKITDDAKVSGKMSLHFSSDTTSIVKLKHTYSEYTSKALSITVCSKKFLLCLAFEK